MVQWQAVRIKFWLLGYVSTKIGVLELNLKQDWDSNGKTIRIKSKIEDGRIKLTAKKPAHTIE